MISIELSPITANQPSDKHFEAARSIIEATIAPDNFLSSVEFLKLTMGCAALGATTSEGSVVAVSFVRPMDPRPPDEYKAVMPLFAVLPELQRQGVGKQLLQFTELHVKRAMQKTTLRLKPLDDKAEAFYRTYGYDQEAPTFTQMHRKILFKNL